jgi:4-amino-4-deoxy-L-arabinose transferase-like glycosyltransferase
MLEKTNSALLSVDRKAVLRAAWPAMLLAAACLLPYLTKAFTIDDPWFLSEARQILKTPAHPMAFQMCWKSEICGAGIDLAPNACLMGYALIPAILANGAEWAAHLEQLIFSLVAVLAMASIALRLGWGSRQAALAGLLLVAIPPFLPMASTAMPDTLGLCLTLAGIERLLAWKAEGRWHQAITAGLALGIAPYARFHLALFLPLGAFMLLEGARVGDWFRQVRSDPRRWAPVGIGALTLASVILFIWLNGASARSTGAAFDPSTIRHNVSSYLLYLTIPIPFALPWLIAHWRRAPLYLGCPLALAIAFKLLFRPSLFISWQTLAALAALAALSNLTWSALREHNHWRLSLVLWILSPISPIIYEHFPIKYLLPIVPAVVLVLLELIERLPWRAATACGLALVAAGTAYSCLLLKADNSLASAGRTAARELIEPHVAAGERVWYTGEWGFYWYAQRAGAKLTRPDAPGPYPGELLAVPAGHAALARFPRRTLVRSVAEFGDWGKTMGSGAALYSNAFGDLLWVWDRSEVARFELWRVQ